jgi:hypothetical protein
MSAQQCHRRRNCLPINGLRQTAVLGGHSFQFDKLDEKGKKTLK